MIINREHYVKELLSKRWNGKVKIITGIRRCGKSFLLSTLYKDYLKAEGVTDDCFVEIALDKIRQIMKIGIDNNHDSLVLGAWGCGIFHNPPEIIAELFKQVLNEPGIKDYFKIVHFAILEDSCSFNVHNPSGNFIPFKKIFENV